MSPASATRAKTPSPDYAKGLAGQACLGVNLLGDGVVVARLLPVDGDPTSALSAEQRRDVINPVEDAVSAKPSASITPITAERFLFQLRRDFTPR